MQMQKVKLFFGIHEVAKSPEHIISIADRQKALDTINERINEIMSQRTSNLFLSGVIDPLDKCRDCTWFHLHSKFCAVAPQNLTNTECKDRKTPELSSSIDRLDYLESRSPERIALVRDVARRIGRSPEELERKFHEAWAKNPGSFDRQTIEILAEIKKIGGYSIAQVELIGDGIRGASQRFTTHAHALDVKNIVLAGHEFHDIIYQMLLTLPGYF
jgi:hypothetical protein